MMIAVAFTLVGVSYAQSPRQTPAPSPPMPDVQGISCNADGGCPWYCVGCGCCGNTCWFGAGLVNCKNEECELCKATAMGVMSAGGEVACDVMAAATCAAAGGAFLDPIADAVCPFIAIPLCNAIFAGSLVVTPAAACHAIGMCPNPDHLDAEFQEAMQGGNTLTAENRFDEAGRRIGFAYAVYARQDAEWVWNGKAEDVNPYCATFKANTHGCDTLWMKQNCAGTCRRCPGAKTKSNESENDE